MLGATELERSLVEKDLGVLVETKLNASHECVLVAKQANGILGCTRQSIASRSREVILPLCSALVRPDLDCWIQLWAAPVKERHEYIGKSPVKGHKKY